MGKLFYIKGLEKMKILNKEEAIEIQIKYENMKKIFKWCPLFQDPSHFWGKKTVKHQHKDSTFQGMCAINWNKFKEMKKR